jgi:hypothetical protein
VVERLRGLRHVLDALQAAIPEGGGQAEEQLQDLKETLLKALQAGPHEDSFLKWACSPMRTFYVDFEEFPPLGLSLPLRSSGLVRVRSVTDQSTVTATLVQTVPSGVMEAETTNWTDS